MHKKSINLLGGLMPTDNNVSALVAEIKTCTSKLSQDEGGVVLTVLQLAGLYVELRKTVQKGDWQKTLAELKASPRVVSRYLKIGKSWCAGTPVSTALVTKLPYDLHKLEWLSKLSPQNLAKCLESIDCKQGTRAAVIQVVKELLGEGQAALEAPKMTVQEITKRWSGYIDRMVTAIGNVDLQAVDDQRRRQLLDELYAKFCELEDAINTEAEGHEPDVAVESASFREDDPHETIAE